MVCGTPSSVMLKSFAVKPSIGLPDLSLTVTVSTVNCAPLRKTGGACGCGCCAVSGATSTRASSEAALRVMSEPHPKTALHLAHRVGLTGEAELRAGDNRVHRRERPLVDDVAGIEPPIEREPAAPEERSAKTHVEAELGRTTNKIEPRGSHTP